MNPGRRPNDPRGRRGPWPLRAGFLLLGLLVLLTGCETLDSRLARNQAILLNLPPEHQSLIRQGHIAVGFTPEEVYLAWGAPSHKAITESVQGRLETWSYTAIQTDTYYREEHYYDWDLRMWRFFNRPYSRQIEYLYQEATFANGALASFTIYPSYRPYASGPY